MRQGVLDIPSLRVLCEWFWFNSDLGAFHFRNSLIVALVKGSLFTFFKCFQTFVFRFIALV